MSKKDYCFLADLLEYPEEDYHKKVTRAVESFKGSCSDAEELLKGYCKAIGEISRAEQEELYTRTFDLMPVCVPYVSIHLFGEENFKRGEFMARLNASYQAQGFEHGTELPDHIGVLLRFLSQAENAEREEMLEYCVLAPLQKMISTLKEDNPYALLLKAAQTILKYDHPNVKTQPLPVDQKSFNGTCAAISTTCGCGSNSTAPNVEPQLVTLS